MGLDETNASPVELLKQRNAMAKSLELYKAENARLHKQAADMHLAVKKLECELKQCNLQNEGLKLLRSTNTMPIDETNMPKTDLLAQRNAMAETLERYKAENTQLNRRINDMQREQECAAKSFVSIDVHEKQTELVSDLKKTIARLTTQRRALIEMLFEGVQEIDRLVVQCDEK